MIISELIIPFSSFGRSTEYPMNVLLKSERRSRNPKIYL